MKATPVSSGDDGRKQGDNPQHHNTLHHVIAHDGTAQMATDASMGTKATEAIGVTRT